MVGYADYSADCAHWEVAAVKGCIQLLERGGGRREELKHKKREGLRERYEERRRAAGDLSSSAAVMSPL